MTVAHRLYRRTDRVLVSPSTPGREAYAYTVKKYLCGWYPQSALSAANKGPGVRNGNAGVPLLGPGSFTWVGLNYDLLTQSPPPGALLMQANAGLSLFPSSGAGSPLLSGSGAGTPLLSGSGAGTPLLGSIPLVGPGSEAAQALAPKSVSNVYIFLCADFDVPTTSPAVGAMPAVYKDAASPGWDAGAVSSAEFFGRGRVSFRVNPGSKSVVGMLEGNDPTAQGARFYGFVFGAFANFSVSTVQPYMQFQGMASLAPPGRFVDTYTEATVFAVERSRGLITFKVDGKVFYQDTYSSFGDNGDPQAGAFGLAALIYYPGGWVDGLEVYGFSDGGTVLPTLTGRAGVGSAKSGGATLLPALKFSSHAYTRAAAVLPPIKTRGGRALAEGYGVLRGFVSSGSGGSAGRAASRSDGVLPSIVSVGGRKTAGGVIRLPHLTTASRVAARGAGTLPPLSALGGRRVAQARAALPALKVRGFQGIVGPNRSAGALPAATAAARGFTGTVARASTTLPGLIARGTAAPRLPAAGIGVGVLPAIKARGGRSGAAAGTTALPALRTTTRSAVRVVTQLPRLVGNGGRRTGRSEVALPRLAASGQGHQFFVGGINRGESSAVLPGILSYGLAIPSDEAAFYTSSLSVDGMFMVSELLVVMNSAGAIVSAINVAVVADAAVRTSAALSTPSTLTAILAVIMQTEVLAGADTPLYEQNGQVWAVNLAEGAATSTFEGYPFNSFGVIGGRAFGAKQDGVFLLEGDTDAGALIRGSVSYGKQDFGTKTEKHMTRAYVGASSAGTMYLKIISNGAEYIYAARGSSTELQQQRFDVGRGLKGNYFTFELFNKDGGDFEIDSVSFFAAEFKRRI